MSHIITSLYTMIYILTPCSALRFRTLSSLHFSFSEGGRRRYYSDKENNSVNADRTHGRAATLLPIQETRNKEASREKHYVKRMRSGLRVVGTYQPPIMDVDMLRCIFQSLGDLPKVIFSIDKPCGRAAGSHRGKAVESLRREAPR